MNAFTASALSVAILIVFQALTVLGVWLIGERRWPAQTPRPASDRSNLHVWVFGLLTQFVLSPAMGVVVTMLVNRLGGGLIDLPTHGWGLLAGVAAYFVAMDFGEFAFHRAQHRLPWLWAWHSLHHSDTSYDATTTVRHFWMDQLLKSVTIWLAIGLLFKAAPPIPLIYGIITLYNFVIHSNTRLDFGRGSWVLNAPGYHRLHHSSSPEHFDINFAALLPIFDVLGGTYRPAKPGEVPATGLDTGDTPREVLDVVVWPVRDRVRRPDDAGAAPIPQSQS